MAKEVLDLNNLSLWYCGKEMTPTEKPLSHFMGKNEKTTVIIKLTKVTKGNTTLFLHNDEFVEFFVDES